MLRPLGVAVLKHCYIVFWISSTLVANIRFGSDLLCLSAEVKDANHLRRLRTPGRAL